MALLYPSGMRPICSNWSGSARTASSLVWPHPEAARRRGHSAPETIVQATDRLRGMRRTGPAGRVDRRRRHPPGARRALIAPTIPRAVALAVPYKERPRRGQLDAAIGQEPGSVNGARLADPFAWLRHSPLRFAQSVALPWMRERPLEPHRTVGVAPFWRTLERFRS